MDEKDTTPMFREHMPVSEVEAWQRLACLQRKLPPGIAGEVMRLWHGGLHDSREIARHVGITNRQAEQMLDRYQYGWRWTMQTPPEGSVAEKIVKLTDTGVIGATDIARKCGCNRQYVYRVLARYRPDYAIRFSRHMSAEYCSPKRDRRRERQRAQERAEERNRSAMRMARRRERLGLEPLASAQR